MISISPIPGANGDIRQAVRNLLDSIPKDTVVECPYIDRLFDGYQTKKD